METEEEKRTWHKPELRKNTVTDSTSLGFGGPWDGDGYDDRPPTSV